MFNHVIIGHSGGDKRESATQLAYSNSCEGRYSFIYIQYFIKAVKSSGVLRDRGLFRTLLTFTVCEK
jgi:hypothetical protein